MQLSDGEQTDLLAYEIYRQARLNDLLEQMSKKHPLSKKAPTEASPLTPEVFVALMLAHL